MVSKIDSMSIFQLLVASPSLILSTGRNWRCLCGWDAPEWSPELKKANRRCFPPEATCHSLKQAYVASRSSCSKKCVCFLFDFVARMKCSSMIGNLLSTRRWVAFVVGISTMCNSGGGFSKGSTLCFGVASSCFGIGFFASEGQKRSWNYARIAQLSVYSIIGNSTYGNVR
jgi:hypothetical protein